MATATVVLGGAARGDRHGATAPATTGAFPQQAAPLGVGGAGVAADVADLDIEPAPVRTRTADAAVTAFATDAAWLIGSAAARADTDAAIAAVGSLPAVEADALRALPWAPGDRFAPERGAYRVLGHAGDAERPQAVMVEVVAPLDLAGRRSWSAVGGVVTWSTSGWRLTSISPHPVPQPAADPATALDLSDADRNRTLAGPGWRAFAGARRTR